MVNNNLVSDCLVVGALEASTMPTGRAFGTVLGTVDCAKQLASRKVLHHNDLRDTYCAKRRGGDSNPRYRCDPVRRFSKPLLSATQPPLLNADLTGIYRCVASLRRTALA